MFNKEEKYTMKEFEDMFVEAQAKALANLNDKTNEVAKEKGADSMASFMMSMQAMLCYSELYKILFKDEE